MTAEIPSGYQCFTIESVSRRGDHVVITYGGRIFGGIIEKLLPTDEIRAAVQPGATIIVRYHTPETGQPGQVAHLLMRHPCEGDWAELYADWA